jgi:metal transporter CNNM
MNASAYETLPIFLDNLLPTWMAILLSTTLIMWFGEILPSGIFTGPHQLYLGCKLAPITRFFLWVMYPFAKPLALVLDYLVKDEDGNTTKSGAEYNRGELSALVRIQYEDSRTGKTVKKRHRPSGRREDTWYAIKQEIIEKANERFDLVEYDEYEGDEAPVEQLAPPLHETEIDLIEGALQMKTVLVMDVYTPLAKVYAIADDMVLDKEGFVGIYRKSYSRVPVYRRQEDDPENDEKTHILGFLIVRQLILIDWDHEREVSTLPLQRPLCVSPRMNLVEATRILRTDGFLMAFVCARPDLGNKALNAEKPIPVEAGFMGIVTLADVMESLLQQRIYDEWDIRDRDRAVATLQRWAAKKLLHFIRKSTEKIKAQRRGSGGSVMSASSYNEQTPLLERSESSFAQYV